ncbi:hypothetical protein SAMN04515674_105335 [Pseudarcicella hirudinis]|uniref:Uncharacterized protein n=1 Tax=Pseudarcicella hirudinis TaxID=1079859 RepID=A0A1I5T260_9BACT|nr:hypothetical protein [Pseudarcicella hirudinis]SFP77119.1 hypothetical protein SAMN04515674_105335 [Pseudarcicella hirudinis]
MTQLTIRTFQNNNIKVYADKSAKYKGYMSTQKIKKIVEDEEFISTKPYEYCPLKLKAEYERYLMKYLTSQSIDSFCCEIPYTQYNLECLKTIKINYRISSVETILFSINKEYWECPSDVKFAKLKAREVGLNYYQATINHPGVNPLAFKIWEEISWKKSDINHGKRRPDYLYKKGVIQTEAGKGFGAWDSQCVWGVSPNLIAKAWFLSGAKDCPKFRIILKHLHIIGKNHGRYDSGLFLDNIRKNASADETYAFLKGKRFAQKWQPKSECDINGDYFTPSLKYKDYVRLGKVSSLPVRLALITNMKTYAVDMSEIKGFECTAHYGILNYEYAKEVMGMSKKEQAKLLPNRAAWFLLYGRCPFEGKNSEIPNPNLLSIHKKGASTFIKLCKEFGNDKSMLLPNFNLATLFGSESEIAKFSYISHAQYFGDKLPKSGDLQSLVKYFSSQNYSRPDIYIHDLGQFNLPKQIFSPGWKDFVMKHLDALKFSGNWNNIEDKLGRLPKSMSELREIASQFHYDNVTNIACAQACFELRLDQSTFERYQTLYKSTKVAESCPDVRINNNDFVFRKLEYNDPKGALLGLYTNCCQHLHGAASDCAKHGVRDETSAFYVVEKAGKIIAQSWAWRSKKGDLVFDSIESLSMDYSESIAYLYKEASKLLLGKLGINRVLVGDTGYGITGRIKNLLNEGNETFNEKMASDCSYMDGNTQWLLSESNEPIKKIKGSVFKPTIKKEEISLIPCNELLPGSEVLCEYCDAEVHPDCEICPVCNENIAEWV